jgi:hypothetical protein
VKGLSGVVWGFIWFVQPTGWLCGVALELAEPVDENSVDSGYFWAVSVDSGADLAGIIGHPIAASSDTVGDLRWASYPMSTNRRPKNQVRYPVKFS